MKNWKIFFPKIFLKTAFYGLDMELTRNRNLSKVETVTGPVLVKSRNPNRKK